MISATSWILLPNLAEDLGTFSSVVYLPRAMSHALRSHAPDLSTVTLSMMVYWVLDILFDWVPDDSPVAPVNFIGAD